eukprot:TRINITY_DN57476_c0_g1_i2.p1 TRINITY_DN57476_c0_g1~~TRINITY_DN57476_c0_g1_i2.p1  ORF type:complete len:194 (+),score=30.75 TRINITY_DN57476_c0_g1_i2:344-925(+)
MANSSKVLTLDMYALDRPRDDELWQAVAEAVEKNYEEGAALTIFIKGPLGQQLAPRAPVIEWFRERSVKWKDDSNQLRISLHLRRGDTAKPTGEALERWDDKYGIQIYEEILERLQSLVPQVMLCRIDIFTEPNFSYTEANSLKSRFSSIENGRTGIVTEFVASTGRYGVKVEGDKGTKAIKPAYLRSTGSSE